MFAGVHPFPGKTTIETTSAIMTKDPSSWPLGRQPPPLLYHVIRKALAKDPGDRYQSVHEMLTDLRAVAGDISGGSHETTRALQLPAPRKRLLSRPGAAALIVAAAVIALALWLAGRDRSPERSAEPIHRQITFLGTVDDAGLSPDGRTIAFVTDDGGERRLFVQDVQSGPALELPTGGQVVFPRWAPAGDLISFGLFGDRRGVYVVNRFGGPMRLVARSEVYSSWAPDGARLAVANMDTQGFTIVNLSGEASRGAKIALPGIRWLLDLDWHPALDLVAALGTDDKDQHIVWIVRLDGQKVERLFQTEDVITTLHWSATGDAIYALQRRHDSADLIVLPVVPGREAVRSVLLTGLTQGDQMTLSADGRALSYVRRPMDMNLWMLDPTIPKDTPRRLTSGTGAIGEPAFSPDGQWIAAVSGENRTRIVKIPAAGGAAVPLTTGEWLDRSPAWSPEGRALAFASNRDRTPGIWVMSADGLNQQNLNVGAVATNMILTWAPDGRIAWQQTVPPNFLNFRLKDLKTGEETYLSPSGKGWIFNPEFSPVSDDVAVHWNRPTPGPGLYLLSGPTREERRLTTTILAPIGWSPDGKWIYAHAQHGSRGGRELVRVSPQTGDVVPLASIATGMITSGDVSRDGRQIVLCVTETKTDVWRIEQYDGRAR